MRKAGLGLLWILLMALLVVPVLADPPIGEPPFYKYPFLFDPNFDVPDSSYVALGPGLPNPPRGSTYLDGKWYSSYWGHLSPESYGRVENGAARLKAVSIDHSPWVFGGTMVNQGRASHLAVQLGYFKGSNTTFNDAYPTSRIIFNYGETIPSGTLWLDVRARILDRAKMNYENPLARANLGFNFQFQPEYRDGLGNVVLEDYDNPDFLAGGGVFPKVVHFDIFLSNHNYPPFYEYEEAVGHENRQINCLPGIVPDADLHVQRVEGQMPNINTWYTFNIDLGYAINSALQMTEDHYYNVPGPGGGGKGFYTLNRLILRNIQLYTEASGGLIEAEVDSAAIYTPAGGGGGCPYVSTWNSSQYLLDNNLIPEAEYSNGTDVVDYYKLQQPLIRNDGKYSLLIWDLDKHSFLDTVELLAVDHESNVNVAVTLGGQVLTYNNPIPPLIAFSKNGTNVTDLIESQDSQYYQANTGDYIQLDFSSADIRNGAKLVIRSDPEECWYSCLKSPVYIQVFNSSGVWQTVATIYTRLYWTTDIIDMSSCLPDANGELKVRISFTSRDRIDFIGLDTTKQGEFELRYANLATANHTRLGDVKELFQNGDNLYVELLPVEEVALQFTLPQNLREKRDFILILEGHYFKVS